MKTASSSVCLETMFDPSRLWVYFNVSQQLQVMSVVKSRKLLSL